MIPERGWLNAIRTALGISLRKLGGRLEIATQSVHEIEDREADGPIILKTLQEAAKELDLEFVYVLLPRGESLESMIEQRVEKVARSIVLRTSKSMELEEQAVSSERIDKAIRTKKEELLRKIPRYLWD